MVMKKDLVHIIKHIITVFQEGTSKLTHAVNVITKSGHYDGQSNFQCVRKSKL